MAGLPDKVRPVSNFRRIVAVAAIVLMLVGAGIILASRFMQHPAGDMVVQFELNAAEAQSVYLVGDFSGWDPLKIPLKGPDNEGTWKVKIWLKKNRSYTYNFLINGEIWIPDPEADLTVNDGFGGINSIINL